MSWSLRPATPDDVPAVLAIEKKVHKAPWVEGHFQSEFEKPYSRFLVMTDDETDSEVAGYIVYWLLMDGMQILDVAVDLSHRGQGLAKQMIRQAVNEAIKAGATKAFLEVRKSNQPAIQLYQRCNFTVAHVRKSFYSDGEDAYQMELPLEEDGVRF